MPLQNSLDRIYGSRQNQKQSKILIISYPSQEMRNMPKVRTIPWSDITQDGQPLEHTWWKGNLPPMNLKDIAHYFIDHLSMGELEKLEKIVLGLSRNKSAVTVGTTYSGIEFGTMVTKALFAAINERFSGANVQVSGLFAAEIDPQKRQFIIDAHGADLQHVFGDVTCFGDEQEQAYCYKTEQHVSIPQCFLTISGISCVNLSGERSDRADFATCYSDGSGESGHTYRFGYKGAVERTGAQVSIYENVLDASYSLKDPDGVAQPPATEIIAEDFRELGHVFEFSKLCSSNFLVPQRRSRVWGSSCAGEDESEYGLQMRLSMLRMQGSLRFSLDDVLEKDLPKISPTATTLKEHIQSVKKLCQKRGLDVSQVTMDTAASSARGPEWTCGMLTCCRPSHKIFHLGLQRMILGKEMLRAHGIFPESLLSFTHNKFLFPITVYTMAFKAWLISELVVQTL